MQLRPVLRLTVGLALAVAAFEPIARFFCTYPTESHPVLGLVPAAGATVRWCLEGCGTSHWQADGLRRSAPHDPARPAILAVGDSFTEAFHVNDEETFVSVLERQLRAAGRDVDVLNVGHSAFSAADYLGLA